MTTTELLQKFQRYYDLRYNETQLVVIASYLVQQVGEEHHEKLFAEVVRRHELRFRSLPGVAALEEAITEYNATAQLDERIAPPRRPQLPAPDDEEELIPFNAAAILAGIAREKAAAPKNEVRS